MSRTGSRTIAMILLLALVLVLSACAPATTTPKALIPLTVIVTNNAAFGNYLTDAKGMSLYLFTPDTAGKSTCTGACLANWPPLTIAKGTTPAGNLEVKGTLGTITRDDGTEQVTINGLPLYYFAKDTAVGDTKGQAVGGSWYLVDPAGKMIK
jgi:predicted lipoprotein with Yx(FWY)xxD motif